MVSEGRIATLGSGGLNSRHRGRRDDYKQHAWEASFGSVQCPVFFSTCTHTYRSETASEKSITACFLHSGQTGARYTKVTTFGPWAYRSHGFWATGIYMYTATWHDVAWHLAAPRYSQTASSL